MSQTLPSRVLFKSMAATVLLLSGCENATESVAPAPEKSANINQPESPRVVTEPQFKYSQLALSENQKMRYTTLLPREYSPDKTYPLVLGLHFGGRVTPYFGGKLIQSLLQPGLYDLAMIVAPDSLNGRWNTPENEAALLKLINEVESKHKIDPQRRVLTGFSMGGQGTWTFGAKHQDMFSAAIPIAGRPSQTDVSWTIPLYVIHSRADTVVPIEPTQEYVRKLREEGTDVEFIELDDIPHYETVRFAGPLHDAIPWIQNIWADGNKAPSPDTRSKDTDKLSNDSE